MCVCMCIITPGVAVVLMKLVCSYCILNISSFTGQLKSHPPISRSHLHLLSNRRRNLRKGASTITILSICNILFYHS